MTTESDISPIFKKALEVIKDREDMYGDSWKENGLDTCLGEIDRKAIYIKAQRSRGKYTSDKFKEDLLDLVNWSVFAYWHVENKEKK
jgi:hypothetical protein